MFCRNCGKELSKQAVACIGCGMDSQEGDKNCPACGKETKERQIICTACGGSLEQASSKGWSTGAYIGLLIVSFFIPLFGWIYGGIEANKATQNSKRKKQAWHYIISGVIGCFINLMIIGSA